MDPVVVQNLGKRFRRRGVDRPSSFKEAVLTLKLRIPAEEFWGLRDISFSVPAGRTIGIVGKNGAGKSTLLRLIGGVITPDEGDVAVHGRIGALLDLGAGLSDDLTGRENIFLSGVIAGMTRAEVGARFDSIVAFAELEDVLDDPIRIYSSGMRLRLAFAVAAHIDPDILLIDEVLAVGDAAFHRKCLERIRRFKASGCTIFLVSHEATQVRALCDQVILLRQGRMLSFGPTHGVMDQYEALVEGRTQSPGRQDVPDRKIAGGGKLTMGVTRFGTQQVQIEAVRVLNHENAPTNCIVSGDGIIVEVDYHAKQPALSPNVSIGVHLPDGIACLDTNTQIGGLELPNLSGRGTLRLTIGRLDLCGGDYFVNVGLYERDWDHTYDCHELVYPLRVIGANSGRGIMNPPNRWERVGPAESAEPLLTAFSP
ncbi:MAG: transporter related [Phenylobacterium sp.]|nr:transporter related [Phenylobacterium sp.]